MYLELVEHKITNRNNIVEVGQIPLSAADYCRYVSLFPYDKGIINYIKVNGGVSGYKGLHYCPAIVIDIDCEDLEQSRQSALQLIKRLSEVYVVNIDHVRIYFSGNKGFHISLNSRLFGAIPPHKDIATYVKLFVSKLTDGIQHVDLKIYEPLRLFRCSNTLNEKSNLYKVPLTFDELNSSIDQIKQLAAAPRGYFQQGLTTAIQKNEQLYTLLAGIKINETTKEIMPSGFFSPPQNGERNNKLFIQACMLFDKSELSTQGITEIVKSINQASENPLHEWELINIIQSAEKKTARRINESELILKTLGGWIDEWHDSIKPETKKLSLCYDKFDYETNGKLRGKLVCVVGYAGTKKSLYAQNIARKNIVKNAARTIYSTMEMGVSELMNRFIDMAIEGQGTNASYELETLNRKYPDKTAETVREHLTALYRDFLLVTQNTGLTCKQYDELIERANAENGQTDILIVDGLSMMGGSGTEMELVNKHTKELKELAVKHNILVIAIVHVTKEADPTTRDYTKFLRGSGKIYDNLDMSINMSLFRDNFEDGFLKDNGYSLLINKRGTGNFIGVVYSFDQKMLTLNETDLRLSDFKL